MSFVQVEALWRADPSSKESYRLYKIQENEKTTTEVQKSAVET
jgi:hypothetical protein